MPRKGTKRVTDAQRKKIAAGKLAGKRSADIAKETGLAISTVKHQAGDPRTQTLIQRLKSLPENEQKLTGLWDAILSTAKKDLASRDPDIRRHARNAAMKAITLGDPSTGRLDPALGNTNEGDFTLEELLITYRVTTGQVEKK